MRISDGSSDVCSSDLEMLLRRHHGTESEIAGRGAAVEFRARHVALLDAQGAERLEAIRNDAEGLAGLEKACPHRFAVVGAAVDLVGELAREGEEIGRAHV